MVWDCFTFFNELDLLEIRLNTLDDVVDKFVLAEATRTHTGKPKPLYYRENASRFAAFKDKIVHIVVDDLLSEEEVAKDAFNNAFVNENLQRNALQRAIDNARDDDIVLLSDLDEIPRPIQVRQNVDKVREGQIVRFQLKMYTYFLNFKNYRHPDWLLGTQMLSVRTLRHSAAFDAVECGRSVQSAVNASHTMTKLRFLKPSRVVKDAGWHFTYMGGLAAITNKLRSIAESEVQNVIPKVEKRLAKGENIFGGKRDSFAVPVDDSLPKYLFDNRERYASLFFEVDDAYLKRTAWPRRLATLRGVCYRFCVRLVPGFLVGPLSAVWRRVNFR